MKIKVRKSVTGCSLNWRSSDTGHETSFYLSKEEVKDPPVCIRDGFHLMVLDFGGVQILSLSQNPAAQTAENLPVWRWSVDRDRFFGALHNFIQKGLKEHDLDLNRLSPRGKTPPALNIMQILRHPNVLDRSRTARTLKAMWKRGSRESWDRLIAWIRITIDGARFAGIDGEELAFNGRIPGGIGYNGAAILHRDGTISVHT